MRRYLLVCSLIAAFACTKKTDEATTAPPPGSEGSAASVGEAANGPSNVGYALYATTLVRREPVDDKEIDDPGKKKKVPNWLATLYRGEQLSVLEAKGDWLRVRTSDEKEGWAKTDQLLLAGTGVELATTFDKIKTFGRPDLLALNANRVVEPGTLLFITRNKEQFSEVNTAGSATSWVLTDTLSKDGREVEASKLINKARWLQDHNDAAAQGLLDLARNRFEGTKLIDVLIVQPQLAAMGGGTSGGAIPAAEDANTAAGSPGHGGSSAGDGSAVPANPHAAPPSENSPPAPSGNSPPP